MKLCKKLLALIVAAAMLTVCAGALAAYEPQYPEVPEGYDGYVTFAVSTLTLGWSYQIDPVLVPVHEGETVAAVTDRFFTENDVAYTALGTVEEGFYLTGVACYDSDPYVPEYLMNEILAYPAWADEQFGYNFGGWTGQFTDDEMLSGGEYCDLSGWMYTDNNVDPGEGADAHTITIGHAYTWIFTIYGFGMDYGISDGWGSFPTFDNPMEGVDRTDVSIALAQLAADENITEEMVEGAFDQFIDLLTVFYDPETDQETLDAALAAFLEALQPGEVPPTEFEPGDVNMDGVVDANDALAVMRAAMGVAELSEDAALLADFDGDGEVDMVDALLIMRSVLA